MTLIDANHCPGAAQLLFELPDGRRYIHCGDMRYSPKLLDNPHLARFRNTDGVFLDTTYAHPRHAFPAQVRQTAARHTLAPPTLLCAAAHAGSNKSGALRCRRTPGGCALHTALCLSVQPLSAGRHAWVSSQFSPQCTD